MKVLSLDLSFAKTGWAVTNIKNDQCILIDSGLIVSDKSLDDIDRIIDTINKKSSTVIVIILPYFHAKLSFLIQKSYNIFEFI